MSDKEERGRKEETGNYGRGIRREIIGRGWSGESGKEGKGRRAT